MRTWIAQCICFLFIIASILLFAEWQLRQLDNTYSYKQALIESQLNHTELLVLGHSHAFYGIDPEHLDAPAINMANKAQALRIDSALLNKYIDKMTNLKLVVLPVANFQLAAADEEEGWRQYFYHHYMNIGVNASESSRLKRKSLLAGFGLEASMSMLSKPLRGIDNVYCTPSGQGKDKQFFGPRSLADDAPIRVRMHQFSGAGYAQNFRRLAWVIQRCAQKEVNVLLVRLPVSRHYRMHAQQVEHAHLAQQVDSIAQEYANTQFLDFFSDHTLADSLFYDADHLNRAGAVVFTQQLNSLLKER